MNIKNKQEMSLENPEQEESEKKISDKVFISAIIVVIMILAAIFSLKFLFKDRGPLTIEEMTVLCLEGRLDEDQCYVHKNAYVFVKLEGLWYTRVQSEGLRVGVPLHFHPGDLADIPIIGSYNYSLFNQSPTFYITFDPLGATLNYVALAVGEFDRNMLAAFDKKPIAACLINETDACNTRPIINCTNTKEPVVYMKQAYEPAIILDDNCITIQGWDIDLVKATDRMLLIFYSIM